MMDVMVVLDHDVRRVSEVCYSCLQSNLLYQFVEHKGWVITASTRSITKLQHMMCRLIFIEIFKKATQQATTVCGLPFRTACILCCTELQPAKYASSSCSWGSCSWPAFTSWAEGLGEYKAVGWTCACPCGVGASQGSQEDVLCK